MKIKCESWCQEFHQPNAQPCAFTMVVGVVDGDRYVFRERRFYSPISAADIVNHHRRLMMDCVSELVEPAIFTDEDRPANEMTFSPDLSMWLGTVMTITTSQILDCEIRHGHGFNSHHELFAIIKEELDEYWETVKANRPDINELIDIACAALRGAAWYRGSGKS